jgi:phosphoglycerate dehydrogenase-like enzyme
MTKPVLVLWLDQPEPYINAIQAAGLADQVELISIAREQPLTPDLSERADALVAWNAPPKQLGNMPKLRWLQALTAGVDGWLARSDLDERIVLTCASGVHRIQMPENILAALFHLTKPYTDAVLAQRERRWTRHIAEPLAGKTLGILGLGTIGRELARKAAALELRVIGTKYSPKPIEHVEQVYPVEQTEQVLAQSDFVLLLLPVTAATRDFIDAERLAQMKPDAYLLNFSRGQLVVDEDLVQAVNDGVIAGAVLDVFRTEPLPQDHPFWTTDGITVLPHIGGLHPQRDELVAELLVDNLRKFLSGETLRAVVDRERGY